MRNALKFSILSLLLAVVAFVVAPIIRADEYDKETVVTFSEPVEVPGQVLPAGTYVFKLANSQSDRFIVQIFTADQKQLLATILAIPDYREDPADKTVITFDERPSGNPEAVRTWFYPGDNSGFEFVYPKSAAPLAVNSQPATPATPPAAPAEIAPTPSSDGPVAVKDVNAEEEEIVTEVTVTQHEQAAPATLPQTAGNFLAVPVMGLALLLGGGLMMLRKAPQRA